MRVTSVFAAWQVYLVEVPVTCINENGGTASARVTRSDMTGLEREENVFVSSQNGWKNLMKLVN